MEKIKGGKVCVSIVIWCPSGYPVALRRGRSRALESEREKQIELLVCSVWQRELQLHHQQLNTATRMKPSNGRSRFLIGVCSCV